MAYIGKEPAYGNLVKQTLTPNGVTTVFTLDYYVSTPASLIVSIGGVLQSPDVSYTITGGGNQITFDEAPPSGLDVFLIYLGIQGTINTPAAGTVTTATIADYNVTSVKMSNTGVTAATYGNATLVPSLTVDGQGRITSAGNISTDTTRSFFTTQSFLGSSSAVAMVLGDAAEVCNVTATAASGNVNIDVTSQPVLFYTANATTNWTMNVRASGTTTLNSIMANGQSITTAFLATQGTTAYFANALLIDGTSANVTTRWQGGTAPTAGNASSIDVYSLTIIKTGLFGAAGTYTVLASQTRFA